MSPIKDEIKRLENEKKKLVKEMENLENRISKNEISEEDYSLQKNLIERKIVEIMDLLVQYRFLEG